MKMYNYSVMLPLTKARADVYQMPFDNESDVEVNVLIENFNVEFDEPDFWQCEIIDAIEVLPDGREVEITDLDEICMIDEQVADDLAADIDPSDYYPDRDYKDVLEGY